MGRHRPVTANRAYHPFCFGVFLASPHVIPHPPTPYVIWAWWTSSIGTEPASGCAPDSRQPPPAGGMRPSWPGFGLRSGDVHFSQPGPLSSPYPTSRSPTMVRPDRRGFIPANQTKPNRAYFKLLTELDSSAQLAQISTPFIRFFHSRWYPCRNLALQEHLSDKKSAPERLW